MLYKELWLHTARAPQDATHDYYRWHSDPNYLTLLLTHCMGRSSSENLIVAQPFMGPKVFFTVFTSVHQ